MSRTIYGARRGAIGPVGPAGSEGVDETYVDDADADVTKNYIAADKVISDYVDSKDASLLTAVEGYADTADATTLAASKAYADSKDATTLSASKSYADSGDISTLAAAEAYADTIDPGLQYNFAASTSESDPGAGTIRLNNGTASAATKIFISETDIHSVGQSSVIASWDDQEDTASAGIMLRQRSDHTKWATFWVTDPNTDNGTWDTINVTYKAGPGGFSAAAMLEIIYFMPPDTKTYIDKQDSASLVIAEAYADSKAAAAVTTAETYADSKVFAFTHVPAVADFTYTADPAGVTTTFTDRSALGVPGVRLTCASVFGNHTCARYLAFPAVGGHQVVVARLNAMLHGVPKNTSVLSGVGLCIVHELAPSNAILPTDPIVRFEFAPENDNATFNVVPIQFSSSTAFSAFIPSADVTCMGMGPPKWLKLDYNTTTHVIDVYIAYDDKDGIYNINWITLVQLNEAQGHTFIGGAPTHLGIYVDAVNVPGPVLQVLDVFSLYFNP